MEPREALGGVLGGSAILLGGTVASVGLVVVLPVAVGYHQGLPAALSSLLGCSVVVVFIEPVVALYGVSHVLSGVLNTPKTAAMLAVGYSYDDVDRTWVDPNEGTVVGRSAYSLAKEDAALKADAGKQSSSAGATGGEAAGADDKKEKEKRSGDTKPKRPANARGVGGRRVKDTTLYGA